MPRSASLTLTLTALLGTAALAQVKNPGTLVSLTTGDWTTFDPAQCYDTNCEEVLQNTLETLYFPVPVDLVTRGSDPRITYQPQLALAMPRVSDGGRTVTVRLNPAARFSDGTPVLAADVKYSLMRQLLTSSDEGPAALLLEPLLGQADALIKTDQTAFDRVDRAIGTPDARTVVFHLARPFAPFVAVLAHPVAAVYSKAAAIRAGAWDGTRQDWARHNQEGADASPFAKVVPLGSGPFVLGRYDVGQQVILSRNDRYWRPPAWLKTVVIKSVDDPSTALQLLKVGDADQLEGNAYPRNVAAQFAALPGVTYVDNIATLGLQAIFMNFNIKDPARIGSGKLDEQGIPANFFSDLDVRRAFAASFDYQGYLNDQLLGKGVLNNSAIQSSLIGFDRNLRYRFDPRAAVAAFKRAWGGAVWRQGFTVPVYYTSGNANRQAAAMMLKRNIEALNPKFHVDVREAQASQILSDASKGFGTVWMVGWVADYGDPHNFAQPFLASSGHYPQQTGYRNPVVDCLIDQAVAETDPARREQLYLRAVRLGFADVAEIPVVQGVAYAAQRDWVKGRVTNPLYAGDVYYYTKK